MALPTILVNSSTGSDTLASGAGPATALTGSAGVSAADGLSVVLDGSPDLSGVATDGSHVLYFADATAGNKNFVKITATANSGTPTATVTVTPALGTTLTKAWAIGGVRATLLSNANSYKLIENNAAAGDAFAGWIIELQSGHGATNADAKNGTANLRRSGDTSSGTIWVRGTSGAATRPMLTFSNNGNGFLPANGITNWQFSDFELQNTNATKTASVGFNIGNTNDTSFVIRNVKVSNSTNKFWKAIKINTNNLMIEDCEVGYCANVGMDVLSNSNLILNNWIHDCTSHGISINGAIGPSTIVGNVITANGGSGISLTNTGVGVAGDLYVTNNTIDGNTSDGITVASTSAQTANFLSSRIESNLITNNGGYRINFSGASVTDLFLFSSGTRLRGNVSYNNTSGDCNLTLTLTETGATSNTNPVYTAGTTGGADYSIGTAAKALGYPLGGTLKVGTTSNTNSYVDPGAAQRQEPAGGTSYFPLPHPGVAYQDETLYL